MQAAPVADSPRFTSVPLSQHKPTFHWALGFWLLYIFLHLVYLLASAVYYRPKTEEMMVMVSDLFLPVCFE